jgi:hypothetical protein
MYVVNAAGTVYKLMAKNTVESEVVTIGHPFQSCDRINLGLIACSPGAAPDNRVIVGGIEYCQPAMCNAMAVALPATTVTVGGQTTGRGVVPQNCGVGNSQFQSSYGRWGGFSKLSNDMEAQQETEIIICATP